MKCSCKNDRFKANQRCYHEVTVDENGDWISDEGVTDFDKSYGPFSCTKCGKVYDSLEEQG